LKKLGAYCFIFLYLIASTGFSVNVHYCSDDVAEVAILSELSGNSCDCDAVDGLGSCCQEKSYIYQVKTEHLSQVVTENPNAPLLTLLEVNQPQLSTVHLINTVLVVAPNHSRQHDPPIRILYCVFTI
jgi:hypothetical protein